MGPWGSSVVGVAILALVLVVLMQDCQEGQVAPMPRTYVPDAKRGEEIFRGEAMCLTCHSIAGVGAQNGPDLEHVASKFIRLKGGREQARRFFVDHLIDPVNNPGTEKAKYPFTQMPSFLNSLGEEKIQDIAAYLLTLE